MVQEPASANAAPSTSAGLYQRFLGPLLRRDEGADAEQLSRITLGLLGEIALRRHWPVLREALDGLGRDLQRRDGRLQQTLFGCRFSNPVGLAAGVDTNGVAAGLWDRFGFGFAELGTVTWEPQEGNPRPRLFRLAEERAALNRMGFNNQGARGVRRTLERQALPPPGRRPAVLGLNIGKSR
ncbi:MAG: dihydroorotate dehydrogenase (quinone), partial [Synechococcus sp.]|nr:dihydroorotate dehydrogenase (quinone) [Synechococcus sp.]